MKSSQSTIVGDVFETLGCVEAHLFVVFVLLLFWNGFTHMPLKKMHWR
jgi:hypothetical protein